MRSGSHSPGSTIKVPIALAVVARGPEEPDEELIDAALTVSDNEASLELWKRLGPPEAAAAAVQDVLASAAGMAAMTRLLLTSMLFSALLVGLQGVDTVPAAVLAASAAWLAMRAIDQRSPESSVTG